MVAAVSRSARHNFSKRAELWIQEESEPRDLVARASHGYSSDLDPTGTGRVDGGLAHEWLDRGAPFVLEPADVADVPGVDPTSIDRSVVAPLRLECGANRTSALRFLLLLRPKSTRHDRPVAPAVWLPYG